MSTVINTRFSTNNLQSILHCRRERISAKMTAQLIDYESILSGNEHWSRLDEEWGTPVDLETEEEYFPPSHINSYFSTMDLRKPTFDSAGLIKNRKLTPKLEKTSQKTLNYNEFLQDLDVDDEASKKSAKQFYFVGGEIISAVSVDEICKDIDDVFKSVEKLCATTSTVRARKKTKSVPKIPDIIECSISMSDLSFDETKKSVKEKSDQDIDRYIDELFREWNETLASVHKTIDNSKDQVLNESAKLSVTNLVHKFTSFLESPVMKCSPRKRRDCNQKFQSLAEYWNTKTLERK